MVQKWMRRWRKLDSRTKYGIIGGALVILVGAVLLFGSGEGGLFGTAGGEDRDGDGVADANDSCPDQSGPGDNNGCPYPDSDGDGLTDNVDGCPNQSGPGDNNGCPYPDSDGDGLTDNADGCPNQSGPGDNNGCPYPDSDGDGLTDNVDGCPNQSGPGDNNGCPYPDSDGDGLTDNVDGCPNQSGPGDNNGCPYPDSDGDGLTDNVDSCPNQSGPGDNNGCPYPDSDGDGLTDNVDGCPNQAAPDTSDGCLPPTPEATETAQEEDTDTGVEVAGDVTVSIGFSADIAADGTVSFSDTSTSTGAEITGYAWDFGDGASGSGKTTQHQYTAAGTYTVKLTITLSNDATREITQTVTISEEQIPPMSCGFDIQPQGEGLPLTVNFVNTSTEATGFQWSFGTTSRDASQTYTEAGTYTITLTCTGPQGTLTATGQVEVRETEETAALEASFTVSPSGGTAPLTVQFSGSSSGENVTYEWDLGDNSSATGQTVSHTYEAAGTYTITLVVTDAGGNRVEATGSVEVVATTEKPNPAFTVTPQQGEVTPDTPLIVTISDTSTGGITAWSWNFGNGQTATGKGPHSAAYTTAGTYTITLNVEGPGGTGQATRQVIATAPGAKVEAIFSFTRQGPVANGIQTICFTNTSTGNISTSTWDFGDGSGSVDVSPCHDYAVGTFTATLSVTGNEEETSTASRLISIAVGLEAPIADFSVGSTELIINETVAISNESTGIIREYTWTTSDGQTSSAFNPSFTFTRAGTYTITLRVTGPGGSSEAAEASVTVTLPTIGCSISGKGVVDFYETASYSAAVENLAERTATFRWLLNGQEVGSGESLSQLFNTAGSLPLVFEVLVDGNVECSTSQTVVVRRDALSCDFSGITAPLLNQTGDYSATLTGLNGREVINETWTLDGEAVGTGNALTYSFTASGNRTLIYRAELSDGTPCERSKTIRVSTSSVACSITGRDRVDAFETITYGVQQTGATGNVTYNWSTGATTDSITYLFDKGETEVNLSVEISVDGEVECTATRRVRINNSGGDGLTCDIGGSTSPLLNETIGYRGRVNKLHSRTATYQWMLNGEVVSSNQDYSTQWTASGSYELVFTVTPSVGEPCNVRKTITVASTATACAIDGVSSAESYRPYSWTARVRSTQLRGLSYRWLVDGSEVGSGTRLGRAFSEDSTLVFQAVRNGQVECEASKQITVTEDRFTCEINGLSTLFLLQDDAFSARTTNDYGRTLTYDWRVNDQSVASSKDLSYVFNTGGSQTLTLIVTPSQGAPCTQIRTITVSEDSLECRIEGNFTPPAGASTDYSAVVDGLGSRQATYEWTLDGNAIGSGQGLSYTFEAEGNATLGLRVTTDNSEVSCSVSGQVTVQAAQSIRARVTPEAGIVPLVATFSADTTNIDRSTLTWFYPDGSTHRAESSSFLFTEPGEYSVRVTGRGPIRESEATVVVRVGQETDIRAAFTPSRFNGIAPMEVCFTDNSQGDQINQWEWTLGNGQASTEQNPCTTYEEHGRYTVTLRVTNVFGLRASATNVIRTFAVAESNISFGVTQEPDGTICFSPTLPAGISVERWIFGDGSEAEGSDTICHTYEVDGDYEVTMVVTGEQLESGISRRIQVRRAETQTTNLPLLTATTICSEQGEALFTIRNEGGDMPEPLTYTVTDNQGEIITSDSYQLAANEEITFSASAIGTVFLSYGVGDSLPVSTICTKSDEPDLVIAPTCVADGIARFVITNNGASMTEREAITTYQITTADGNVLDEGELALESDETATFEVSGVRGVITFATESGIVSANTSCEEPDEPTTPEEAQEPGEPETPICGMPMYETTGELPGFPEFDYSLNGCTPDPGIQRAAWQPIDVGAAVCVDWLVYHTNQTGDWEIFRLGELPEGIEGDPNLSRGVGTVTVNGREVPIFDVAPSRSPDGLWIAFASFRDGNWEIYVASVDNQIMQRVTYNTGAFDLDPMWSPDGSRILYESAIRDQSVDLYMINVTDGEETRLTFSEGNDINGFWSPDGTKIIFQSDRDGFWQLYELDLITMEERLVSDGSADDHDPVYSFDGERILFRSFRDGKSVIYVMNVDGTELTRISGLDGNARNHTWSPEDQVIAYQSDRDGDLDIYAYEVATGETRLVTDNDIPDYAPTWYCDSPVIVFTSDVTGNPDIFSTPALPITDGSIIVDKDATQLTFDEAEDKDPQNSPPEENASRGTQLPSPEKNR